MLFRIDQLTLANVKRRYLGFSNMSIKKWWSLPYIHVNKSFTRDILVRISVPITATQRGFRNFLKAATYLNDTTYKRISLIEIPKTPNRKVSFTDVYPKYIFMIKKNIYIDLSSTGYLTAARQQFKS